MLIVCHLKAKVLRKILFYKIIQRFLSIAFGKASEDFVRHALLLALSELVGNLPRVVPYLCSNSTSCFTAPSPAHIIHIVSSTNANRLQTDKAACVLACVCLCVQKYLTVISGPTLSLNTQKERERGREEEKEEEKAEREISKLHLDLSR